MHVDEDTPSSMIAVPGCCLFTSVYMHSGFNIDIYVNNWMLSSALASSALSTNNLIVSRQTLAARAREI